MASWNVEVPEREGVRKVVIAMYAGDRDTPRVPFHSTFPFYSRSELPAPFTATDASEADGPAGSESLIPQERALLCLAS